MTIEQLRARVAQLEEAIDRAKVDSANASAQLEKEEDEGAVLSLWARITARKNAGKTLVEQLATARAELAAVEEAAAQERYKAAQKAYAVIYADLEKAAMATLAKAEKAAAALDAVTQAQRAAGVKYTGATERVKWGVDPYALYAEAAGMSVTSSWSSLQAFRPWPPQ